MKKTIAVVLALLTALGSLAALSTASVSAAGTWKTAYQSFINSHMTETQGRYKFPDIDGDGIPELAYYSGSDSGSVVICNFGDYGLNVEYLGSGPTSYYKGAVHNSYGAAGYYYDTVILFKNGASQSLFSGSYKAKSSSFDFNNPYDFTYAYSKDGSYHNNVSPEEYKANLSSVFDEEKSTLIDFWVGALNHTDAYSYVSNYVGPTEITGLSYANGCALVWKEAPGADSYQIARKQTGQDGYDYITSTDPFLFDMAVKPGVTCTYQVRGRKGSTYGPWSYSRSVVTLNKPELTVSNKSNGIRAEWKAVPGANRYVIYYKSSTATQWSWFETKNTYYPFLDLTAGKLYYFQVRVLGDSVNGPYSDVKSLTRSYVSNEAPVVTVSNKWNGIRVEWNAIYGATSYIVYYKNVHDSSWSSTETKNTYWPFLSAVSGNAYQFQVQPVFNGDKGAYSYVRTITFYTASNEKPNVTLLNKTGSIRVQWNTITGATSYILYYRRYHDSNWSSTELGTNSYNYTGVSQGTAYCFQVLPLFNGQKGAYSSVETIIYSTVPTQVPKLTLTNTASGVRADWNGISGATYYILYYRKYHDSSWASIITYSTSYMHYSAVSGTAYCFQVQPVFSGEKGGYSNVQTIIFNAYAKEKPQVTLENRDNGIRVMWKTVPGATSYIVYYRKTSDSSWSSATTTNLYYPHLNITKGVSYSYQVQAVYGSEKGYYSDVKSLTFSPVYG